MTADELGQLVDIHGTDIYRFCSKMTGNRYSADDLYQDTFLQALKNCHKIDKDKNPKSFLISISIKLWKSKQRKKARRARLAPMMPIESVQELQDEHATDETVLSGMESAELRRVVDGLEDRFRIPLYLYYTLEMDIAGIAKAAGIPEGTVKSRLHKARNLVKQEMEEFSDGTYGISRGAV